MYKASKLADELVSEYSQNHYSRLPKIVWKAPIQGKGESYFTSYEKGILHVQGESPLAAAYGITQIKAAFKSNHLGEYLGQATPRFPLRPLGIQCDTFITSCGLDIPLPKCMGETYDEAQKVLNVEKLCRRIIELGYNAILLTNYTLCLNQETAIGGINPNAQVLLTKFAEIVHSFGLKVMVQCRFPRLATSKKIVKSPKNPDFREYVSTRLHSLFSIIPSLDYFFWESSILNNDFTVYIGAKDATLQELVVAEMQMLENCLTKQASLVYYIPSISLETAHQQASWFDALCNEAGNKTIISFSAVAGRFFEDHLSPHPFWEELRKDQDTPCTKLLPLVNIGQISQGEGLWPTPAVDLINQFYDRLNPLFFAGALTLASAVPMEGGMLDCSLWCAGQSLWGCLSPQQNVETWFAAFRPEWNYYETDRILAETRQLAVRLSYMSSLTNRSKHNLMIEDFRVLAEHILISLREIKIRLSIIERKRTKKSQSIPFSEYLKIFACDAQHFVIHFLQHLNVSLPFGLEESELKESFWKGKVGVFDEPLKGGAGSVMESIYFENRFL